MFFRASIHITLNYFSIFLLHEFLLFFIAWLSLYFLCSDWTLATNTLSRLDIIFFYEPFSFPSLSFIYFVWRRVSKALLWYIWDLTVTGLLLSPSCSLLWSFFESSSLYLWYYIWISSYLYFNICTCARVLVNVDSYRSNRVKFF